MEKILGDHQEKDRLSCQLTWLLLDYFLICIFYKYRRKNLNSRKYLGQGRPKTPLMMLGWKISHFNVIFTSRYTDKERQHDEVERPCYVLNVVSPQIYLLKPRPQCSCIEMGPCRK